MFHFMLPHKKWNILDTRRKTLDKPVSSTKIINFTYTMGYIHINHGTAKVLNSSCKKQQCSASTIGNSSVFEHELNINKIDTAMH